VLRDRMNTIVFMLISHPFRLFVCDIK